MTNRNYDVFPTDGLPIKANMCLSHSAAPTPRGTGCRTKKARIWSAQEEEEGWGLAP